MRRDNSVPREISALLSNQRLILRETRRAVTPLGGVAVFVLEAGRLFEYQGDRDGGSKPGAPGSGVSDATMV